MVHEVYHRVLTLRYMNSAPQFLFELLSVAKKLPPPEELTTDFIINFVSCPVKPFPLGTGRQSSRLFH